MTFILIFFFSFNHLLHKDLSCIQCHNEKNEKVLTTNPKKCLKCHKENPKTHIFKLKNNKGIKFNHETHQFLSCQTCHKFSKNNITIPKMNTCSSCHNTNQNSVNLSCSQCHKYRNGKFVTNYGSKKYIPRSHHNFNYKKYHIVTNERYCLQCHKKSYCENCHNENVKSKKQKFHPIDYISIHQYEKNLNNCSTCHKNNNDCKECHTKAGISNITHTSSIKKFKIHPKNWNHGEEAYKNINSCATCHNQNECLKCHQTINPHKKIKNICNEAKIKKKSCENCHKQIKDVCP